jgi:diguanylate cyclase
MLNPSNPPEIAREALKQLATRRIPPTPDNYAKMYTQISGTADGATEAFPERQLKSLVAALPNTTSAQARLLGQINRAQQQKSWADFVKALTDFAGNDRSAEWRELLPTLLRQWDTRHASLTPVRKRELLDHVLAGSEDPDNALTRLKSLVKSWSQTPLANSRDLLADTAVSEPATGTAPPPPLPVGDNVNEQLRELLAFTLDTVVATQLAESSDLAGQATALGRTVRIATDASDLAAVLPELKRFVFRLELLAEDRAELRGGLLHLLQLLIENVQELVIDDSWLHGQMAVVRDIVGHPLSLQSIDDAERRLKEVIYKQSQLKHNLNAAREALKTMLAGFVDHLAAFSESTSEYHDKIERCARRISEADNISQLESVIREVMDETRVIQLNAQRSRDELQNARREVAAAELRIRELQDELDQTSELVRHDQLTGALNRRGLEEVFDKEINRAGRRKSPLCLAVLDIDDFKKLNDSEGHLAGDAALVHLIQVIRGTLRPQDTVSRYGGEEFIILMPDTALEDAQRAMVRLQRELTKQYFLYQNKKLLITFSAGVTQLPPDEDRNAAIRRADELMYHAKKTGKNKVVAA